MSLPKDNTKPVFFRHWSREQLENECARLNGLLKSLDKDLDKVLEVLKGKGEK